MSSPQAVQPLTAFEYQIINNAQNAVTEAQEIVKIVENRLIAPMHFSNRKLTFQLASKVFYQASMFDFILVRVFQAISKDPQDNAAREYLEQVNMEIGFNQHILMEHFSAFKESDAYFTWSS
ncbi:unnamed protein product [Caenorhabditis angaria]|uniref:Uncharacterized protein n=1 Tax=Caenorhabditis angaria TaxID=860376 RepID=A0A9P1N9X4_9PELO|nr:unnamed protein product [Caenorhabditis angaria]